MKVITVTAKLLEAADAGSSTVSSSLSRAARRLKTSVQQTGGSALTFPAKAPPPAAAGISSHEINGDMLVFLPPARKSPVTFLNVQLH